MGYKNISTQYSISSNGNRLSNSVPDLIRNMRVFYDTKIYYLNSTENSNENPYHKIREIEKYDSTLIMETLYVPLFFNFNFDKRIGVNFRIGMDFNFLMSSGYKVKSDESRYFIYLPGTVTGNDLIIYKEDIMGSNDLGLYINDPYELNGDEIPGSKDVWIDGTFGLDLVFPIGNKLDILPGTTLKRSLMYISNNSNDYIDIFGQTEENFSNVPKHVFKHKPIKTSMLIFQVGLKYKF